MTIKEALEKMNTGTLSSVELVRSCLKIIQQKDDKIGAFLEVWADDALAKAQEIDEKRAAGETVGELAGIPLAIKDCILVQGKKMTAASKILKDYQAAYSATVVQKLQDADAVLIGRTNMDEFACGGSTEHSGYQLTRNPHDLSRVPGGSSGGSAAAVAAEMCLGALGSDTGGSVRLPASFCGVVGLKPTYGRVSRYGLIAMASSLDQIGPLGKTVDDAFRILHVIEGKDAADATSVTAVPTDISFEEKKSVKNLVVGIPKEYFVEGMDRDVEACVADGIEQLKKRGAKIKEISLPHSHLALATYYVLMPSEVSSNMARFDGIRYGATHGATLLEKYVTTRTAGFGDEVKRRILLGTFALSSGYYEAYYKQSVAVRQLITNDFFNAFQEVDVIVGPTAPCTAFGIGEKTQDPLTMYLADIYTVSANLAGIPAMSIPCGTVRGLPVGLQLMAPHFKESMLAQCGNSLENNL